MTPDTAAPYLQYICNACGYIYKEAEGDPDSGLPPGTRYADIPDDWECPLCAVTKADFAPYTPPDPSLRRTASAVVRPAVRGKAGDPSVVIVGGGRAGWQMAEALRALSAELPITLVSACSADVYDKPLLSVAMAKKLALDQLVRETGAQAAARLGLRLMAQTQATRICTRTHTLHTTRGNLPFEHLVLAHGAQVALPPQLPAELCWRINHLDAYLRLRAALGDTPRHVVIAGAGLIGCELANDLALGGHRVTLLDSAAEPLARWAAQQAGAQLLQAWQTLPIQWLGQVAIAGLEPAASGAGFVVRTACGQAITADQVVVATGLATPSRLAQSAGLAWNNGIAVDATTLATSHPRIHALGDCMSINGQTSRYIEPIGRQARTIASKVMQPEAHTQWVPYENKLGMVRVKTTSHTMNLPGN